MPDAKRLKKGLALIFADFLGLIVGILNGFFLPMVFSIDGYALYRTFTLYATYAVVFSFGLSDGIYLYYGGKEEKDIEPSKTKAYYVLLLKMQAVVFIILFLLSRFILKDDTFLFFSLFVIPLQIIHFFRLYYKALGEFGKYSALQVSLVVFEFLNTILIAFYIKSQQPHLFITIKIINHALIAIILTVILLFNWKNIKAASLCQKDYQVLIKPGFAVLISDLAVASIFTLDRWFVKFLFSEEDFAYYAFAASILTIFLTFITSITNILYPRISRKLDDLPYLNTLKRRALFLSSFFPLGYFAFEGIVILILPVYVRSLDILWIMMLLLPFAGAIQMIYINLYKATRKVKQYLIRMASTLLISFNLCFIAYLIWGTAQAIATATLFSFIFWYIFSAIDFPTIGTRFSEILFLFISLLGFILIHFIGLTWFVSFLLYLCILGTNVFIFYHKDVIIFIRASWFGVVRKGKRYDKTDKKV